MSGKHAWRVRLVQRLELRRQADQRSQTSLQLCRVQRLIRAGRKSPVHVAQLRIPGHDNPVGARLSPVARGIGHGYLRLSPAGTSSCPSSHTRRRCGFGPPSHTSPSDPFQRSASVPNHPASDEGHHMSTREDS